MAKSPEFSRKRYQQYFERIFTSCPLEDAWHIWGSLGFIYDSS